MIEGTFTKDLPSIDVTIAWMKSVQTTAAILDTGFSGDLQIPREVAEKLGLRISGSIHATIASGETVSVPMATAIAVSEGSGQPVQVLIANSTPLAGIGFLTKFGYKAIVDCRYKKVALQKA